MAYLRSITMEHLKQFLLCAAVQIAFVFGASAQSPLGKSLNEVIAIYGSNYKALTDAQGLHIMQYKKGIGTDTVSDLIYFQNYTCVKEVSLRPASEKNHYIDSLNHQFKSEGYNSWRDKDSSFITLSTRDGFLDITSFSNAYYKKIAH